MNQLNSNQVSSIGVRAMDYQHGILMDEMTALRLAVKRGSQREEINELLNRLIAYTRMHFENEEHLMEKSAFPDVAVHRALHRKFEIEILQSAERARLCEGVDVTAVVWALQNGFTEHISDANQRYGEWFHAQGIY